MRRFRGFTLIEVALFLAITGVLFVGIAVGTSHTIATQRFTDSIQNFAEMLRSVYSEVSNPQSIGDGRSELAIYGKLVVFGESVGVDNEDIDPDEKQRLFVYDVVGDVVGDVTGDAATGKAEDMLKKLGANVVIPIYDETGNQIIHVDPAGIIESYAPRWAAAIETTTKGELYKGSILVVRHPRSGTINTLVSDEVIEVNSIIREANETAGAVTKEEINNILLGKLSTFSVKQTDFCVNGDGIGTITGFRRDVRLVKNARNASGVEIMDMDSDENLCR